MNPDPNKTDPELFRKLWARDGIHLAPGEELSEGQKDILRGKLNERRAMREARRVARLANSISERQERARRDP